MHVTKGGETGGLFSILNVHCDCYATVAYHA